MESRNVSAIHVGVARANITPPIGIQMVGFAGRGPSVGLHDDLYATALVFQHDTTKAALIACDLIGLEAKLVQEVREEINKRTDIPPGNIMVSCTHTHYGPSVGMSHHGPAAPDIEAYVSQLKFMLAGAVQSANSDLREARIGVGRGLSDIGINRRERREDGTIWLGQNPDGPVDREVGVIRIDESDGRPLATIINFACHAVAQASSTVLLSADYPGKACRVVEHLTGAPCLFLQGAGGNINAIQMEPTYEPARRLGTMLGCEVVKVWETISPEPASGLEAASNELSLPAMTFASIKEGEVRVAELEKQLSELQARDAAPGSIYWAKLRYERANKALESMKNGTQLPPIEAEVQALRIGDIVFTSAPGEVFTEIGMEIKERSPCADTFFAAYTNGSIGYVPVPEAYPEGGYEVTHACRVGAEAAGLITDGCLSLIEGMSS